MYTVVIPERNEGQELEKTIDNITETQESVSEIIVQSDKRGCGSCRTRHDGLMRSQTEVVITIDAHMRFEPGALDNLASFIAEDETRVACLQCCHNRDLAFTETAYSGADLYEQGPEYVFEAKWRHSGETGEIACLMGACYGLNVDFYKSLGSPWALGRGWGCDEQFLSIATRLAGGSVHVLPYRCSHLYRDGRAVPYRQTLAEITNIHYNRLALIEYVQPDNLAELLKIFRRTAPAGLRIGDDVRRAARCLESHRRMEFREFRNRWMITQSRADGVRESNPVVIDPGVRCPHCGTFSDRHRITNRTATGARRRICAYCGRPFVSKFRGGTQI